MATNVKVCLVGILLQLTFTLGTGGKTLEQNSNGVQYNANGGPVRTKKAADLIITGGTYIKAIPGGMSFVLGKGVNLVKGFIKNAAGKYYDDSTGKQVATDPFHSVDKGKFIVADCGTRVLQVEGNMEKVSATPAATESAPTPAPVVVQPEERTLQEKGGKYEDKATGTSTAAPFDKLNLAWVSTSKKGSLMQVESTTPVEDLSCPTVEQVNDYFKRLAVQMAGKK